MAHSLIMGIRLFHEPRHICYVLSICLHLMFTCETIEHFILTFYRTVFLIAIHNLSITGVYCFCVISQAYLMTRLSNLSLATICSNIRQHS